jgi:hypothetical protein
MGLKDPLEDFWIEMSSEAVEAAPEVRALQAVESWCYSYQSWFYGRHESDHTLRAKVPHGSWAGFWANGDDANIVFYPTAVQNRHNYNGRCCKQEVCVPGPEVLELGSTAVS